MSTVANSYVFGSAKLYVTDAFDTSKLAEEITAKLIDGNLLGCSDSGISFEEEKEIYIHDFAGMNGKKVKGFEDIVKAEAKITGECKVINSKLLNCSLFKTQTNSSADMTVFRPEEGIIDNYTDLVVVGTRRDNKQGVIVVMHNAYNTNFSLETKGAEDGISKVEFVCSYSEGDLNTVPYEVIVPKTIKPIS